jgi:glycine hydroxymethyltransferase
MFEHLKNADTEIFRVVGQEIQRQNRNLEMIASENFVSMAVLEALEVNSPISMRKAILVDVIMVVVSS